MITLSELTEFFGWASIINISFLFLATLSLVLMRDFIVSIHSKLLNISKEELPTLYFNYLANYKVVSLVFFLIPYISLKIMGY
jgi:hypothetical protein